MLIGIGFDSAIDRLFMELTLYGTFCWFWQRYWLFLLLCIHDSQFIWYVTMYCIVVLIEMLALFQLHIHAFKSNQSCWRISEWLYQRFNFQCKKQESFYIRTKWNVIVQRKKRIERGKNAWLKKVKGHGIWKGNRSIEEWRFKILKQ